MYTKKNEYLKTLTKIGKTINVDLKLS